MKAGDNRFTSARLPTAFSVDAPHRWAGEGWLDLRRLLRAGALSPRATMGDSRRGRPSPHRRRRRCRRLPRPAQRARGDAKPGAGRDRRAAAPRGRPARHRHRRRGRCPRRSTVSEPRGPLRGVTSVGDAGTHWHATLVCGHSVKRLRSDGRLTVFSRCHCADCLRPAVASSQPILPAVVQPNWVSGDG